MMLYTALMLAVVSLACGPCLSQSDAREWREAMRVQLGRNIRAVAAKDAHIVITNKDATAAISVFDQLKPSTQSISIYKGFIHLEPVGGTFPALSQMTLSNGNIASIPKASFRNTPNIKELHIVDNNNITYIDVDAFEGLSELEHLDLSSNAISSLPQGIFRHTPNLKILTLTLNCLKELSPKIFAGLLELEEMNINGNYVELTLQSETFANLPNLEELNLAGSVIRSIPQDLIRNSNKLQKLYLTNNMLREIPVGLFSGARQLEELEIASNEIEGFDDSVFYDLRNLKVLNLNKNRIRTLRPALFDNTPSLKTLWLNDNGMIISATHNVYPASAVYLSSEKDKIYLAKEHFYSPFQNLRHLKRLLLSGNDISVVCTDWITSPTLKELDLS